MRQMVHWAMARCPRKPDQSVKEADLREELAAMFRDQGLDAATAQRKAQRAINASAKEPS
jgi:hypothetical protein